MVGIAGYDAGQLLGVAKNTGDTECSVAAPTESFLPVEAQKLENRRLFSPEDE